jgi:hypothetical protein
VSDVTTPASSSAGAAFYVAEIQGWSKVSWPVKSIIADSSNPGD